MFQREVALRIVATPAERADYGRLGVLAGWRTRGADPVRRAAGRLHAAAEGHLERRRTDSRAPRRTLATRACCPPRRQAAFGQRRKMLRQSLKASPRPAASTSPALLAEAGLEPTMRAEEVAVAGFAALARASVGRQNVTD